MGAAQGEQAASRPGGHPALSEIAENKIMGEMNGGARLLAAGEGVEAATDNTIDRVSGCGWTGWRGDRQTDGRGSVMSAGGHQLAARLITGTHLRALKRAL